MQKVKNPKIQKTMQIAKELHFLNLWIFHLLHLIRLFFQDYLFGGEIRGCVKHL